MKFVTLDIRSPSDAMTDFVQAWKTGKPQRSARISFATPELLWQVLAAKRWELLKALCGAEPVSIREAALRAERDVAVSLISGCQNIISHAPQFLSGLRNMAVSVTASLLPMHEIIGSKTGDVWHHASTHPCTAADPTHNKPHLAEL